MFSSCFPPVLDSLSRQQYTLFQKVLQGRVREYALNSRSVVITHERACAQIRWNSGVDGTVRNEEGSMRAKSALKAFRVFCLMMKKQRTANSNHQPPATWTYPLALVLFLAAWQFLVVIFQFPAFILPSPAQVGERFLTAWTDGSLLRHLLATLSEVLSGLAIGVLGAFLLGYLLSRSKFLERVLSPFLVASQAVPIAAIAPLLIIWFGSGVLSKVLICSLTVFFPMLVNTLIGLHAVPATLRDLMRTLHATRWQTFTRLELPASLPVLLGGMRVSATLSVIGAVVGELAGADKGLGFLINVGRGQYDTALVFVAVLTLVLLALILYGSVLLLEKRLLRWQEAK